MKTAQGKSSIPDEIFYDIFSRLPVKSLMRFKCVSKSYNSLFTDLYFVDIHQSHSMCRSDKTRFLVRSWDEENFYTMDMKLELTKAYISRIEELDDFINMARFDYVKGLICLWNTKMSRGPVIYSPSTRKVRSLPHPLNTTVDYCSLGFEPDKKKYKILMITSYDYYYRSPKRYWVLTLDTDESWREIKGEPSLDFITVGRSCTNGAIYLLGENCKEIIEFNVRTENFRKISFLKDIPYISLKKFFNLIELEEKLVAIHISTWKMGEMNLWILERSENSEEWVKHTIALHQSLCFSLKYLTSCFCSSTPDGEIVFITNTTIKLNWIFIYNWKKKSWRSETLELEDNVTITGIYSYVDSLLYLGCI